MDSKLIPGAFQIADGKVVGFTREGINCPMCNDTGKVWVDYGDCEDPWCTAHKGYEDCEACNVRNITK